MQWVVIAVSDVQAAYPVVFSSQNTDEQDWNPNDVATNWIPRIAELIRGSIREGNRVPISLTDSSVPPEAVPHALALVAEQVVANSQRLGSLIITEGENGVLARSITAARTFLEKCRQGLAVSVPDDPDPNQTPLGVAWDDFQKAGGSQTIVSMTTDFANPTVQ